MARTITNIFKFNIKENLQRGDISLRTGQNIESNSFKRLSNFYKLPGLETNKVYLFDTSDPASTESSLRKKLPEETTLYGYIYFYDQNRIFLQKYKPLKFTEKYFPILFRCPEDAVYIRFTLVQENTDVALNLPYGKEKEKQIIRGPSYLSNTEKLDWDTEPINYLYLSTFYAQQEDLADDSKWDLSLSTKCSLKKEYALYEKFNGDNMVLSCVPVSKNEEEYSIIDNFKITHFNTLILRGIGEASYYAWFLSRSVPIDYTVINRTFVEEQQKIYNYGLPTENDLPLERSGVLDLSETNLIQDTSFPKTTYSILSTSSKTVVMKTIDGNELKEIQLSLEGGVLYAGTYPVPSTVTVNDGKTITKYQIYSLEQNLFDNVYIPKDSEGNPEFTSYQIHTLDFSGSNIHNIGSNCCVDKGVQSILLPNGSTSFWDISISTNAFSKNNIDVLEFPDKLYGSINTGAFSENKLSMIFFNANDDSNVFTVENDVFSRKEINTICKHKKNCIIDEDQKGYLICVNKSQYSRLINSQSFSLDQFEVITENYSYIDKYNQSENTYIDRSGYFLYTLLDPDGDTSSEALAHIEPSQKGTFAGELNLPEYIIYNNSLEEESAKVFHVKGIQEGGFSNCKSLNRVTLGFSSKAEFFVMSSSFEGCTSLEVVSLYSNVIFKGNSHFKDCTSLRSFPFQSLTTEIPAKMFMNCTNLSINGLSFLPSGITKIGESAFENHTLENISIPDSVMEIGSRAFATNSMNFSLVIFEMLETSIGYQEKIDHWRTRDEHPLFQKDSFENDRTLFTIITVTNDVYVYVLDLIHRYDLSIIVKLGTRLNVNETSEGSYVNPQAPYEIFSINPLDSSSVLFSGFARETSGLTTFQLKDLIQVVDPTTGSVLDIKRISGIDKIAFNTGYNKSISNITFNLFMTTLEEEVFKKNLSLKSLTFGEQFQRIEKDALYGATNLNQIVLNSSIEIGVRALYQCSSFKGDEEFWSHVNSIDVLGCAEIGVESLVGLKETAKLSSFAFCNCINLKTLPDPINFSIGSQAFDGCTALTSCDFRNTGENYDKFLNPKVVVIDLGPYVEFFGTKVGDTSIVQETYGENKIVHNQGYIFNNCYQIEDYRIVNLPYNLFNKGIFCTDDEGEQTDAWIRLEVNYDLFRENNYILPQSDTKKIYDDLMSDIAYEYHSGCLSPELYYIASTQSDPLSEDPILEIDTTRPIDTGLSFSRMRAKINVYLYDQELLKGNKIPIIYIRNKTSPAFYGKASNNGCRIGVPWYIPHALRILNGNYAGYRLSFVGSIKDIPGQDMSSNNVAYLLGPAYDRADSKKRDWIAPSEIYVSSNFKNIDLLAFAYKNEHRVSLHMDESDCEKMLKGVAEGTVYNIAWGDEYDDDLSCPYNFGIHLPPKGLLYFGKSNSWESCSGGGSPLRVGGASLTKTLIYPSSLIGRTATIPGSLSEKSPSIARLFAHKGYIFTAVYFPKGMTQFYNYTISMRDSDTYPVRTFYFHTKQIQAYDGSFHDTKNNDSYTMYCLSEQVAKDFKDGADKGKWKSYIGTEIYKFDVRIPVNISQELPTRVIKHVPYKDHLFLPFEEFMSRKDTEGLISHHPISQVLSERPKYVLAYGEDMDFSIELSIQKETQEAIIKGFQPEHSKVNLRAYPFARYILKEDGGKEVEGCEIPITTWDSKCCQSKELEILHLPFTTRHLKEMCIFAPNMKHILLNPDIDDIESRSIITKAGTVNNQNMTLQIGEKTIPGAFEDGFKIFVVPRTIHHVESDCIVSYVGDWNNETMVETIEDPNGLRKIVLRRYHYEELEKTHEKNMSNYYIGSEYSDLEEIKERFEGSFIESLPEDIILDDNLLEYTLYSNDDGNFAILSGWRPREYLKCRNIEGDINTFIQEEMERLYPGGELVIPEYLIDNSDPDRVTYYTVVAVGPEVFKDTNDLTRIRFPGSIFYYGENIIRNCSNLKNVEICCLHPDHLVLEESAFLQRGFANITVYTPKHTHRQLQDKSFIDKFTSQNCNLYRLKILDSSDSRGLPIKPYSEE